jgi:hypothetical protein
MTNDEARMRRTRFPHWAFETPHSSLGIRHWEPGTPPRCCPTDAWIWKSGCALARGM